jgi:hypothetical protein
VLTSAPDALVKEPKRESFNLKITLFKSLKVDFTSSNAVLLYILP